MQDLDQRGRLVEVMTSSELEDFVTWLLDVMSSVANSFDEESFFWLALSISMDIDECRKQGKRSHVLQTLGYQFLGSSGQVIGLE